jgi:3-oxoacyl-[acyl-carrier-protein] synthase II
MDRRVVVTGLGVVTALGRTPDALWRALLEGRSAIRLIERFDATALPTRIAGEVPDEGCRLEHAWRARSWAREAASAALRDSGIGAPLHPARCGVSLACGFATYDHHEIFGAAAPAAGDDGFSAARFAATARERFGERPLERLSSGFLAAEIAGEAGFAGPVLAADTACAAGAQALGSAARWIRSGAADVVLAGGADSQISPLGVASFSLLRTLSRRNQEPARASRPFDAQRDGFVLGEGAAFLVLEELGRARRRSAAIHAELCGFGAACDAYRATDPHPGGRGAVLAMSRALRDAGVPRERIAHVNAHGTSTPANDRIEARALCEVFGAHAKRLAVTATKSALGHLTEAAGAVEAVVTVGALRGRVSPPTLNLEHPDPECGLDFTPLRARPFRGDYALSSSFGFGGQCAALVFRRC